MRILKKWLMGYDVEVFGRCCGKIELIFFGSGKIGCFVVVG